MQYVKMMISLAKVTINMMATMTITMRTQMILMTVIMIMKMKW